MKTLKNLKSAIHLLIINIFLNLILLYQLLTFAKKPSCRFFPTCSEYAIEAFKIHGFFAGGKLIIFRLLSCRPYGKSGLDFVPSTLNKRTTNGH